MKGTRAAQVADTGKFGGRKCCGCAGLRRVLLSEDAASKVEGCFVESGKLVHIDD